MFRKFFFLVFTFTFLYSCSTKQSINQLSLKSLNGKESMVLNPSKSRTVLFFLAPDCPLSQNYSLVIKNLKQNILEDEDIILIFPGSMYNLDEIKAYLYRYGLNELRVLLDPELTLTKLCKASVRPECYLFDQLTNQKIYSGKIDNWIISLGNKRLQANEHYLLDALNLLRNGKKPVTDYIEPLGCYIE